MTTDPIVHLETLRPPHRYSWEQITQACEIARMINRGRFVLCTEPDGAQ